MIQRYLSWCEKSGNEIVSEVPFNCDLELLQEIFNVPKDNPMYDCWPVTQNEKHDVEKITNHKLDLKKYDYFLSCFKV